MEFVKDKKPRNGIVMCVQLLFQANDFGVEFFDRSVSFATCFPESEQLGSVSLLTGMVFLHKKGPDSAQIFHVFDNTLVAFRQLRRNDHESLSVDAVFLVFWYLFQ